MMPARPPTVAPFLGGFRVILTREQALEAAKALARDRREKGKQSRRCTIRVAGYGRAP